MQQHGSNYFYLQTPQTLGVGPTGQKFNFFRTTFSEHGHVAYQIKGKLRMQQHGSKYFYPQTPTGGGVKRSKFNCFRIWSCCIVAH